MIDSPTAATGYCADGGTCGHHASSVAAFEKAAQPVYAQLESDPETKRFIQAIRDLKATAPDPASVTPCTSPVAATPTQAPSTGDEPQEFPEGTYRTKMTAVELLAAGLDPGTANGLDGIQTLEFENGRWFHYGTARGAGECTGPYSVEGGRLVVTITPRCGGSLGMLFSAVWTVEGSALTFTELTSDTDSQAFVDAVWGNRVWERIG